MKQYIDKDALVAEIEKMVSNGKAKCQQSQENNDRESYVAWSEHIATCGKILSFISTLEAKEVDLDKEIETHLKECLDVKFPTTDIELIKKDVEYTARMFFELGLKAQKGEDCEKLYEEPQVYETEDGEIITYSETDGYKVVEPKFKVGDWVVRGNITAQILDIQEQYYVGIDTNGNDFTSSRFLSDDKIHLWTIQDAKDGDVLAFDWTQDNGASHFEKIVIFKGLNKDGVEGYGSTYKNGQQFFHEEVITYSKTWTTNLHPATKEQRDLLFSKIKESGYEWDADKKELKKIEQKFKVGNWYQCTKDFFGKGVTFDKNTAYYCAKEGCLLDGCHIAIVKDLYDNFKLWDISDAKDGDVLVGSKGDVILIFRGIGNTEWDDVIDYHCYYDCYREEFIVQEDVEYWGNTENNQLKPATKEQRDLLFQKMKEAGYELDAEKKELNKIEPKSESKSAWSEEDEEMLENIIDDYDDVTEHNLSDDIGKVTWLESLKQRLKGE